MNPARVVLDAERDRHADWHVCWDADGLGKQDYCIDDDETGMSPCPLYVALGEALDALALVGAR